jgi:hypothetical protein
MPVHRGAIKRATLAVHLLNEDGVSSRPKSTSKTPSSSILGLTSRHKDKQEDKPEKKVDHIAPRHAQKKQPTEAAYKDRAEMRRAGKDDEYKDVSHGHGYSKVSHSCSGRADVGGL